jgi:demethylmacrocin O-methyltransferase
MNLITKYAKTKLSSSQKRKLRNILNDLKAIGYGRNLEKLARIYKSDKAGAHNYTPHYKVHFKSLKYKKIKLLEIGAGGFEKQYEGGYSLRMWKKYFPLGFIYSIDIYDKTTIEEKRIKIFQGNQNDKAFLENVTKETGVLDIIIDDACHINKYVIESFHILFPKLKDGGIYVVEDTQTSYWKSFGGDSDNLNNNETTMSFFKNLADSLNNKEFIKPNYQQTYFDKNITSIHFYHNLVFIYKGINNEESNIIINNEDTTYCISNKIIEH